MSQVFPIGGPFLCGSDYLVTLAVPKCTEVKEFGNSCKSHFSSRWYPQPFHRAMRLRWSYMIFNWDSVNTRGSWNIISDQQQQHHLGTSQKCTFLGPTTSLFIQNLWEWGSEICVQWALHVMLMHANFWGTPIYKDQSILIVLTELTCQVSGAKNSICISKSPELLKSVLAVKWVSQRTEFSSIDSHPRIGDRALDHWEKIKTKNK